MGFDAVMRVRTSSGLSPDQYQGAMRLSGTEIQLPGCDANKSVAVVLRYEDKLKENSLAYIQVHSNGYLAYLGCYVSHRSRCCIPTSEARGD